MLLLLTLDPNIWCKQLFCARHIPWGIVHIYKFILEILSFGGGVVQVTTPLLNQKILEWFPK